VPEKKKAKENVMATLTKQVSVTGFVIPLRTGLANPQCKTLIC